jgi:hypothetical protein
MPPFKRRQNVRAVSSTATMRAFSTTTVSPSRRVIRMAAGWPGVIASVLMEPA